MPQLRRFFTPAPSTGYATRPQQGGLGAVAALVLSAGLLFGCAAPPQSSLEHLLPWPAAVGRLDDAQHTVSCTATLVAPDIIATAAHCLSPEKRGEGQRLDVTSLIFSPNLGNASLPAAQGSKILASGGDASGEDLDGAAADWVLIRVTPPVTAVAPIPIRRLTASDIEAALVGGATLSQAGYGTYDPSDQHLYQQGRCELLTDDAEMPHLHDDILLTNCRSISGDSGGPLVLTEPDGARYLVGIISRSRLTPARAERVSVVTAARAFAQELDGTL